MQIESGRHTDCPVGPGGKLAMADDGIRLWCQRCGTLETWEAAARRLHAAMWALKRGLSELVRDGT